MKTVPFETKKAAVVEVVSAILKDEKINRKAVADKYGFSVRSLGRYLSDLGDDVKKELTAKDKNKAPTKREIAEAIFNEMKGAARKDILARFMTEADLTKAGAATYYYNLTKKYKDQD